MIFIIRPLTDSFPGKLTFFDALSSYVPFVPYLCETLSWVHFKANTSPGGPRGEEGCGGVGGKGGGGAPPHPGLQGCGQDQPKAAEPQEEDEDGLAFGLFD